jgi:hypothetical protein
VVDADPAADGFHRSQPLLPHAVRLTDVMDQAKIGGKITGPETLSELPGKRRSAPQVSVQGVAHPSAIRAVRDQHDHDRLSLAVRPDGRTIKAGTDNPGSSPARGRSILLSDGMSHMPTPGTL